MLKITPANHKEIDMHRRDFLKYSAVLGAASALPLWSRFALAADRPALPIPNLLSADAESRIRLTIQAGQTLFNGKAATTWGYNGNLLGPALQLRQGKAVTVNIHNTLAEETTLHWHGLEVPGEVDGGPQGVIKPGETAPSLLRRSSAPPPAGSTPINTAKPGIRWRWGWQVWC